MLVAAGAAIRLLALRACAAAGPAGAKVHGAVCSHVSRAAAGARLQLRGRRVEPRHSDT